MGLFGYLKLTPEHEYLGHFRARRFLEQGHNDVAEPRDTQEFITERFRGEPRQDRRDAAQDRKARKNEISDLRRVQGAEARRFRRENPGADIHDYDQFQRFKAANPGVPVDELMDDWKHADRFEDMSMRSKRGRVDAGD